MSELVEKRLAFIRRLVGSASGTKITGVAQRARPGRVLDLYTVIDPDRPYAGELTHVWGHGRYLGYLEPNGPSKSKRHPENTPMLCWPGKLLAEPDQTFTVLQFATPANSLREAMALLSNPPRSARGRDLRGAEDRLHQRKYRQDDAVRAERLQQRQARGLDLRGRTFEQARYYPIPGDHRYEVERGTTWMVATIDTRGVTAASTRGLRTFTRAAWATGGAIYAPVRPDVLAGALPPLAFRAGKQSAMIREIAFSVGADEAHLEAVLAAVQQNVRRANTVQDAWATLKTIAGLVGAPAVEERLGLTRLCMSVEGVVQEAQKTRQMPHDEVALFRAALCDVKVTREVHETLSRPGGHHD